MQQNTVALERSIQELTDTMSASQLQAVFTQLQESSKSATPNDPRPQIDHLGKLWLEFFAKTDSALTSIRMNLRMPVTKVLPPMADPNEPNPYTPGIDPSEIQDPSIRARYQQAIAENNKRNEIAHNYSQLVNLEAKATAAFGIWAKPHYHQHVSAQDLLMTASKLGLSTERMQKIRSICLAS